MSILKPELAHNADQSDSQVKEDNPEFRSPDILSARVTIDKLKSSLTRTIPRSYSRPDKRDLNLQQPENDGGSPIIVSPDTFGMLTAKPEEVVSYLYAAPNFITGPHKAKIFRPKILTNDNVKGLVMIIHGQFKDQTEEHLNTAYRVFFDHLGTLLASNRFVAVSVRPRGSGSEGSAEELWYHLHWLRNSLNSNLLLENKPIAFIGHSQGAGAAAIVANRIRNQETPHYQSVGAIVSLAGTSLVDIFAESVLCLLGSHDGDGGTFGGNGLKYYREANAPFKSFIWLHGCNHFQYLKLTAPKGHEVSFVGWTTDDQAKLVFTKTQNLVMQNFATMFLRWQLQEHYAYEKIFRGQSVVNFSGDQDISDDLKFRLRAYPLCSSESDLQLPISLPASVAFLNMTDLANNPIANNNPAKFNWLNVLEPYTLGPFITTKGFIVGWNREKYSSPIIRIACNKSALAGLPSAIEFDAIQLPYHLSNDSSDPVIAEVYLKNSFFGVESFRVPVTIEPSLELSAIVSGKAVGRGMLSTISVPRARFQVSDYFLANSADQFIIDFSKSRNRGMIAIANIRAHF